MKKLSTGKAAPKLAKTASGNVGGVKTLFTGRVMKGSK